jgi:hypothetical protein
MKLLSIPDPNKVVSSVVQSQLKKHALPLALTGLGLGVGGAALGAGIGYNSGRASVYDRLYKDNKLAVNMSKFSYMAEFGFMPPKIGRLKKGIQAGKSALAASGDLVNSSSAVRKKATSKLNKLSQLAREYT